jgi:hypothetical protein
MLRSLKSKFRLWRYRQKVVGCLDLLFDGFEAGQFPHPDGVRDLERLIPMLFEEQPKDAAVGAVFAAAVLLGAYIDLMVPEEREQTLDALQGNDVDNITSAGIVHMVEVAASMATQSHVRMLRSEIIGKLQGMDRAQMRKWRVDANVDSVTAPALHAQAA